ncbi:helix-turn-helix domain-containing protein [Cellulosilyticum lentocellum]|uniref:Helix-turn-helix domain protein n=1 Tax=Cellulosilyticum lentocellum (strain ATCC 49066 / DSM 5427 / NCIMB 11756 / RHM5) TaxID=642492 RepID=F2JPG7_CELLD|nr:helix-turn-helix transcriptional regulator [Cellulosilyticum lentocellum]ADZ82515.1 helix-turn-helix domain protein [Cellulosilyticum lentocellum DSM 5427]
MYSIFEQLLQKNGVSSYKVSKDTGIAQSVFSGWKSGKSQIKQDKLKILADYFGVSLNYMMGIEDKDVYENELEAKNATEKELLLLCRKVNDAPEEVREQIVEQFKNTIDIYLKAKGIK